MLITPYDLLVPAGEAATLDVEAERRWLTFVDPPVADVELEIDGVGRAKTNADGIASFPLGVLAPGTYRYKVLRGRKPPEALVRVIDPRMPVIVVDIDHTIADVSPQGFILRKVQNVRPVLGSREALDELAPSMQIVYLTARDHIFTRKTKLWLRAAEFPEAPVYLRKGTRFWSHNPREHKIERLKDLRPRFPNIQWGVGDKPGDVAAYQAHGIRPILLAESRPPEVAPDVPCFGGWKEILAHIKKG
jgi:histidinol phosphatase-like enzyme